MQRLLIAMCALALSSCVQQSPAPADADKPEPETNKKVEPKRLSEVELDGLTVPGDGLKAKALGFTRCEASDTDMVCKHDGPLTFMGVQTSDASLTLGPDDAYAIHDPDQLGDPDVPPPTMAGKTVDQLTYKAIQMRFEGPEYIQECLDKARAANTKDYFIEPDECAKPGSIATVRLNLLKAGFEECVGPYTCPRRTTAYFKRDLPLEVIEAVEGNTYLISIQAVPLIEVHDMLLGTEHFKEDMQKREASEKALESQMK